ncbi:MAG TPA: hypothetical protein PKW28_15755, partial [Turneriella sp.]|nr:hypothetical protein [Turneriella sp.]
MKLTEIAASLGGQVKGNGNLEIQGVRDLELIGGQGRDTAPQAGYIYYVESKKVFNQHPESVHAEALLTTKTLSGNFANAVVVEDAQARVAFIRLLAMFEQVPAPVAA